MLLIYHDEQSWDSTAEAERQQVYLEYRNFPANCLNAPPRK